jgi:hypothetical protein
MLGEQRVPIVTGASQAIRSRLVAGYQALGFNERRRP